MNIEQLLNNADLMIAARNYNKAIVIYNQIIEENSDCDEAYLLRGELFGKLGQLDKAFIDVFKAISIDPDYDESYIVLASLYLVQNNPDKAIEAYQKAIALNNTTAVNQLAQLAEKLADQQLAAHQPDKAINNYKLAIKCIPNNTNYLYKYAFAVARAGDFDNAIKLAKTILKDVPKHVATKSLLVSIYEKTGQHDEGWEQIKSLAKVNPDNPYITITFGKYALRNGQHEEAIKKLKYNLLQPNLKVDDKLSMHMLLGKLYDSTEAYSNAFSHFSQANNLKYNDYDIAVFEQQVSSYISYFTKEKYSQLAQSKNTSDAPVFILGMPRSGTSLLEQIISSHSQVYGAGELNNIPLLAQALEASNAVSHYPQLLDDVSNKALDRYADELLDSMKSLSSKSLKIVDKLPHNFLFIGLIHKLFPNAKIINCVRGPIDNCLSCYFQHFGGYHPYAYNLNHLGKYYRQYEKLMRHWDIELQIPMLNIHYEDVVNDTIKQVENLLSFLDLEWEDACLEFHKNKRNVNTASYTQVEKKIYKEAVNRWKNFEPYIHELINELDQ